MSIAEHITRTVSDTYLFHKLIWLVSVSIAISATTWDGNIFEKPGEWVKLKIGEFWAKPLFACYVCCTFWWSLAQCLVYGWPWYLCFPCLGLAAIISLFQKDD